MSESKNAATELQIPNGPFKGHGPTADEIRPLLDRNGVPVQREGKVVEVWGVHHRTRHVLEVLNPMEGWSIEIEDFPGPFNLPDHNTYVSDGKGGSVMAMQPTVLHKGRVTDPTGRVVARASALTIINGEGAWERGETRVRSRLYEALGLSTPNDVADSTPEPTKANPTAIAGATAVDAPIHQGKLPEAARQMIEGANASAECEAESSATTTAESTTVVVETKPAPPDPSLQQDPSVTLNQNLLRQAIQRAKNNGVEVPTFTSNEQLQAFYKGLLKKAS